MRNGSPSSSASRRALLLGALWLGAPAAPRADITVGPWTFEDTAFADDAVQLSGAQPQLFCGATDVFDALTGHSPDRQVVNVDAGMTFRLDFLDHPITNVPGDDVVFFETRFSADSYEIAFIPRGGELGAWVAYPAGAFVAVPEPGCDAVFGVPIDLDDHGLAEGTVVTSLAFRSTECVSCLPRVQAEGDPLMAGVLSPGCARGPDFDGDGTGDPCDCAPDDPGSSGVPSAVRELRFAGDERTLRARPDDEQASATYALERGELTALRERRPHPLTCVARDAPSPVFDDPEPPPRAGAFYYLARARTCFGAGPLGLDSFGGRRRSDEPCQ